MRTKQFNIVIVLFILLANIIVAQESKINLPMQSYSVKNDVDIVLKAVNQEIQIERWNKNIRTY